MIDPLKLLSNQVGSGAVEWIGIRPGRRQPLEPVSIVEARAGTGLAGDHFAGKRGTKRQVTLVQKEHLAVVASILKRDAVEPGLLRRNIVVSGVNLLSLVNRRFRIGKAVLEGASACHPCSRMEENLGRGGLNAMRGHGGITARVIESGEIRLGHSVSDLGAAPADVPNQSGVNS
jgi:MOSC domain-containing protein YiiM